jgi:hypothetical protein
MGIGVIMSTTILQMISLLSTLPSDMTVGQLIDSLHSRLAASAQAPSTQAQSHSRSTSTWNWSDGSAKVEIVIEGQIGFADDYSDVKSISDNGSFRLQEQRGNVTRRIEIAENSNATQRHSYFLDGQAKEFDAEAKAWLARTLARVIPGTGIDAAKRVEKLLKQGGPSAVLEETSRLSGDRNKRVYFEFLFSGDNVDPGILRNALQQLSSDYEVGNLIIAVSEKFLRQPASASVLFEGVKGISSSYEQRRVLSAMVKNKNLSHNALLYVLKSATSISSDYDKANFLLENSAFFLRDPALRSDLINAVDSIRSETDRRRVQSALLK